MSSLGTILLVYVRDVSVIRGGLYHLGSSFRFLKMKSIARVNGIHIDDRSLSPWVFLKGLSHPLRAIIHIVPVVVLVYDHVYNPPSISSGALPHP